MTDHPNLGSTFDSWLDEEGIAEDVEALAAKKKLVLALDAAMARRSVSRAQLARDMKTSRTTVHRLLDPDDTGVSLATIVRASNALKTRLVSFPVRRLRPAS
jgi:antitoxin HicB